MNDLSVGANEVTIYPNPSSEFIAILMKGVLRENMNVQLLDLSRKVLRNGKFTQGSTIWHLDIRTLYDGEYIGIIGNCENAISK